ncbi:hypothetical protein QVH35_00235 [Candidatus Nitrosotenuis chungbukensis]|uniref:hypothetical protein n=1 Tax=Candidatus Nitrosotenuis chungbukensis TaxID=1353246 RepID=UPI002672FA3C|nr:hypothetical protein [Candidatus Nitrosotenuis chungbukensis]WKT58016.1 hypothetical protein QVH35_00235 [Candidatus Nitrosotenuis chungbukensis]
MDHKISVSFTVFVLLLGLSGYSISNASSINNVDPLYGSHTMKLAFAESHNSDGESEDEDHDEQESESEGEDTEDEESEEIDEETESEDSDERDSEEDANKAISDAEDEIKKSQEKIAEAKEKGKITSASEACVRRSFKVNWKKQSKISNPGFSKWLKNLLTRQKTWHQMHE